MRSRCGRSAMSDRKRSAPCAPSARCRKSSGASSALSVSFSRFQKKYYLENKQSLNLLTNIRGVTRKVLKKGRKYIEWYNISERAGAPLFPFCGSSYEYSFLITIGFRGLMVRFPMHYQHINIWVSCYSIWGSPHPFPGKNLTFIYSSYKAPSCSAC